MLPPVTIEDMYRPDRFGRSAFGTVEAVSYTHLDVYKRQVGQAVIDLKMKGPGLDAPQSFAINVTPGTSELYRRDVRSVAAGSSLTISSALIADFIPGTGAVSVAVSPFGGIDVPALLQALDRYPYGCTEQTVSRALPLLYVNKLASIEHLSMDADVEERVKKAIERVLSRQDSNGAFGLWSACLLYTSRCV